MVTSPRLSPYASNDSLYDEQRPQLISQQCTLSFTTLNTRSVAATGPRLWSRRTSVQRKYITVPRTEIVARA